MLGDITMAQEIYIACGYTGMRKSIDGLAVLVKQRFQMDPYKPALYLFCGRSCNQMKYFCGKAMDLSFFTNALRTEDSSDCVPKKN